MAAVPEEMVLGGRHVRGPVLADSGQAQMLTKQL